MVRSTAENPESMNKNSQIKILGFVCNWHSFQDTNNIVDHQYPADVKLVRVMCSSRIDRNIILKAVEEKIDGIFIVSCTDDNCHYKGGNILAKTRLKATAEFLHQIGYDKNRIQYFESENLKENSPVDALNSFTKQIISLGSEN